MANLLMPLQIERQYSASLDANYEFGTLDELKDYATASALSYPGQILYCKAEDALYKVNATKTDVDPVGEGGGGGAKTYTSLAALGLTADATLEDTINALQAGESLLIPVNAFTNYTTMFPDNLPSDQYNKLHIVKGSSLPNSHVRCFSQSGAIEYIANMNNTNVTGWNDVSGVYIDISDNLITKLGTEILKYPVGKYRINSTATGSKFTDLPTQTGDKCGVIEINGTAVGKSPFTDSWVYRIYKFEPLTETATYVRKLNSDGTAGNIAGDSGWVKYSSIQTYTSLAQLGLTADATLNDAIAAMSFGSSALLSVTEFTDYQTIFPYTEGNDQFGRVFIEKGNDIGRVYVRWFRKDGKKEALAVMNINNNQVEGWNLNSFTNTYTNLLSLGLDTNATLSQVVDALKDGDSFFANVKDFANYQTMFPYNSEDDQYAYIHIIRRNDRVHMAWYRANGSRHCMGNYDTGNKVLKNWVEYSTGGAKYYRITAQATDGYFKFKASDAYVQQLNITATDNYGGCVVITGQTTSDPKYYPFKAVRLSNGDWYSPLSSSTLRNKIEKLYSYDGYLYLKVASYTTITFTGLSEAPTYVETLDNTDTEIPITSLVKGTVFTSLEEIGLTADATIDDVINTLSNGDTFLCNTAVFTNYKTMFPNTCNDDLYASITIRKYDGRPFLMWYRKDGKAYAFGGLTSTNSFQKWFEYRFKADGYADDSIVCIGDTASADGVIQTLASLGFTTDVMTWDTGVYRVSHVSGLTNLPSDLPSAAPGFRLEHYDCKKWGANHNPNKSTWAMRHSVLYAEGGNIYHRYTESGANAGVYAKDTGWKKVQTTGSNVTLVTNTQTLKLDVTKKNSSWYGAIKLTYLYDTSPVEVEISFRSVTDDVRWAVINGQKYINKITYTNDSTNTAHYTIGIEFAGTTYGCYQAEVIGGFADINSLTADAFTGDQTAVYNSPWGKNNGVTLVSAPEDLGLAFPCTTVELAQAMRAKFNKTINSAAIGVFNNGGKTVCITDAPSDYGLLHIETFGYDRVLIRYDGIASSTYTGSWIGKIEASSGTFSGITWENINPFTSNIYKTYAGTGELNSAKGTSITLESNVDNTQKIIDALGAREEFVEWYGNSNNRFGLAPATYGNRINYLRIVKMSSTNAIILAVTSSGIVASRTYADGTLGDWCAKDQQGGSGIYLPTTSGAKMNIKFTRLNLDQSVPMKLTYYLNGNFKTAEFYVNTMSISYSTNDPRTILDARHDISSATQAECNMYIEFSGTPSLLMLTVPPEFGVVTSFATGTTVYSKYVLANENNVNFGTLETSSSVITKYNNIKSGYVVRNGVCYFGLTIHTESGYAKGANYLLVDGLPASIFEYCAASIRIWGNVDIDSTYQSSAYVQNGELRVILNIESGKAATISIYGSYPIPYA
jgi:hypothetical protein